MVGYYHNLESNGNSPVYVLILTGVQSTCASASPKRLSPLTGVWTPKAQPERLCSIVAEGNTLGIRSPGIQFALQGQTRFPTTPELFLNHSMFSPATSARNLKKQFLLVFLHPGLDWANNLVHRSLLAKANK
jgi:hypothetical protein